MSEEHQDPQAPCEHCGIFTIPGPLAIQSTWRDITFDPVRGNIWTVSEGIYRTIFVEGKKGVIAFDTLTTPGTARAYAGAIQRVLPRKQLHTVVYSHEHLDHTGYAADLAPDADILAHELCDKVIRGRESDGQLPATETFSGERQAYELDGVRFELLYPGPTHGDGNIAAYFPDQKVLFMVDTVIPGVGYTFFPDWHLTPYVPAMKRLLSLDWDIFVPGHFWVTDRRGFEESLKYYDDMAEVAQDALSRGIDPQDWEAVTNYTRKELDPRWGHLFRFDEYCAMNLSRYMQQFLTGGWGIEGNMRVDPTPF